MNNIDWNAVEEAKEYSKVGAGGYVVGITAVDDVTSKEYLKIEMDIAEGELKNYYRDLYQNKGFWGLSMIKSYKETALSFFKAFKTAVENSNKGYVFKNDPESLKRKLVGVVLGEEEYQANDCSVKTRLYVAQVHSADKIRKGDFEVPPLKKLGGQAAANKSPFDTAGFEEIDTDDGDLPF